MLPRQVSIVTRYQIPKNHTRRTRVVRDITYFPGCKEGGLCIAVVVCMGFKTGLAHARYLDTV